MQRRFQLKTSSAFLGSTLAAHRVPSRPSEKALHCARAPRPAQNPLRRRDLQETRCEQVAAEANVATCRHHSFLVFSRFRKIYGLKYWKRRVARLYNLYFAVPEKMIWQLLEGGEATAAGYVGRVCGAFRGLHPACGQIPRRCRPDRYSGPPP
jgi:hypothetical protein